MYNKDFDKIYHELNKLEKALVTLGTVIADLWLEHSDSDKRKNDNNRKTTRS
jgi:polyphosphate kinase 2 (PPK2 family)